MRWVFFVVLLWWNGNFVENIVHCDNILYTLHTRTDRFDGLIWLACGTFLNTNRTFFGQTLIFACESLNRHDEFRAASKMHITDTQFALTHAHIILYFSCFHSSSLSDVLECVFCFLLLMLLVFFLEYHPVGLIWLENWKCNSQLIAP